MILIDEDIRPGLEIGAVDYIAKPFGLEFVTRFNSQVLREIADTHL
jgi:DNA-binding response OmpR family regulator